MLSRYVGKRARDNRDPAYPLRQIAPAFSAADLAFVNLESPFAPTGPHLLTGLIFRADPAMVNGLTLAGIDIVSTANNHSRDQGVTGLEYTYSWLREHGIVSVGAGPHRQAVHEGQVLERNGVRFGFLAYTYDQSNGNRVVDAGRVAETDVEQMRLDVCRLRQRADVVIVSMHAGVEYSPVPNKHQVQFARAAIDAGARVVAGHHPHVVQPVENYKEGLILYSLGNLVFDQFQRRATQQGLVVELRFSGDRLRTYRKLPVDIRDTVPVFPEQQ